MADEPRRTPLAAKFRQAAFVYLHVGILYEVAVWVLWRQDLLPEAREPVLLWLALGAVLVAAVFAALWYWQNVWVARGIWLLHALRLPFLMGHAFTGAAETGFRPAFYQFAIVVVLINLGFLARAGWDL